MRFYLSLTSRFCVLGKKNEQRIGSGNGVSRGEKKEKEVMMKKTGGGENKIAKVKKKVIVSFRSFEIKL